MNDDGLRVTAVVLEDGVGGVCEDESNSDENASVKLVPCMDFTGDDETTSKLVIPVCESGD